MKFKSLKLGGVPDSSDRLTRAMSAFSSASSRAVRSIPVGYAGFIPGLMSGNFHGAPWKVGYYALSDFGLYIEFI